MKTIIIDGVEYNLTPKIMFKNGTWLVENEPNNYARFIQILEVVDVQGKERYRISRDLHNDEDVVECRFIENNYHSFNIQDAKDGDVLYTSSTASNEVFIFKELTIEGYIKCYCSYDSEDKYCEGKYHFIGKPTFMTHPATAEQRDLLFQKMKEAGYEWDAEKKELRKIEQTPAEAEKGAKGNNMEIPFTTWSEEDKDILFRITDNLKFLKDTISIDPKYAVNIIDIEREIIWLKNLKDRVQPQNTWKPSDTEINILQGVIDGSFKSENVKVTLGNILEQLKKLRGE